MLCLLCLRAARLPLLNTTSSRESDTVLFTSSSIFLLNGALPENSGLYIAAGTGSSIGLTGSSSLTHFLTWYLSLLSLHSPDPNILKKRRDFLLNEFEGRDTFCLFLLVSGAKLMWSKV